MMMMVMMMMEKELCVKLVIYKVIEPVNLVSFLKVWRFRVCGNRMLRRIFGP
jgi:hypothetical protein